MNVIDHAILIPASPEFIWRFLGDISQNSQWQEDCSDISFLTTQHEGRGTRWRYPTPKGKDVIVEITAWYDTLGYEYTIVEGTSVSANQGRIRLQEIAEGTLVQWTFNYELDGMLGGLRNSIGLKRSLTNNIQDSLRNLYKLVQKETGGISTHEARSLLKEAPDVEQREQYQPRYPSNFKEDIDSESYAEPEYPSESSIAYQLDNEGIVEPPVADDDTKPNPVVQGTDEIEPVDMSNPTLINQIQEPPVADDDTKPNAPIETMPETSQESVAEPLEPLAEISEEPTIDSAPQPDVTIPSTESQPDIRDTSRISVFEVFGLQKPSETQELNAISDADIAEMAEAEDNKQPIVEIAETEDNKRSTIESEVIHVDEPLEGPDDFEPTNEDEIPQEASIADIPEVITPDALEDKVTVTIPTTSSSKTLLGLRIEQRRKLLRLRHRK